MGILENEMETTIVYKATYSIIWLYSLWHPKDERALPKPSPLRAPTSAWRRVILKGLLIRVPHFVGVAPKVSRVTPYGIVMQLE